MNLEHIRTMLEASAMALPKWTQTQSEVKEIQTICTANNTLMAWHTRLEIANTRSKISSEHITRSGTIWQNCPTRIAAKKGSNATPTGARPPKRTQDPWVRPTHPSPNPKAPVNPSPEQAKWLIDVRNIPNSLPPQAQHRLKQRQQIMTLEGRNAKRQPQPSKNPTGMSKVQGQNHLRTSRLTHEF